MNCSKKLLKIRLNNYGSKHYVYGTANNSQSQTDRLVDIFQVYFDFESLDLVDKLIHFSLNTSNVHSLQSLASVLYKLKVFLQVSSSIEKPIETQFYQPLTNNYHKLH